MKKKKSIFSCDLHHSSKKALCLHKQEKIEDKNDDVEIVDIVEHNDIEIIDFVKGMNQKKIKPGVHFPWIMGNSTKAMMVLS